jgi:hypothetical protein
MRRFGSSFVAGASLLALMLGAQKSAYSAAIAGDSETRSSPFSALDYQPYDIAVNGIYGTTASARPSCFIQKEMSCSGFGGERISYNIRSRSVRNDCTQRKSSESNGGSIWLGLFIQRTLTGLT